MSIREELLESGFSEQYIDKRAKEEYDEIIKRIEIDKYKSNKVHRFSYIYWVERQLTRLAYKLSIYERKKSNDKKLENPEFTGDRNNPADVWEYNARNGIMPIETIDNKDGTFKHTYEDGTVVTIEVTLTGVIDGEMFEKMKKDNKRFLADYLKMDEEEVINMDEDEIESLVKKNEFNKKVKKVLRLNNN